MLFFKDGSYEIDPLVHWFKKIVLVNDATKLGSSKIWWLFHESKHGKPWLVSVFSIWNRGCRPFLINFLSIAESAREMDGLMCETLDGSKHCRVGLSISLQPKWHKRWSRRWRPGSSPYQSKHCKLPLGFLEWDSSPKRPKNESNAKVDQTSGRKTANFKRFFQRRNSALHCRRAMLNLLANGIWKGRKVCGWPTLGFGVEKPELRNCRGWCRWRRPVQNGNWRANFFRSLRESADETMALSKEQMAISGLDGPPSFEEVREWRVSKAYSGSSFSMP